VSLKWTFRAILHEAGLLDRLERWRAARNFRARRPHEAEFRVLARVASVPLVMFDVGANAGQSALSARIFHPTLRIHSFEPNERMKADLEHVRTLLGAGFEYSLFGLGAVNSVQPFYVPYVSGVPLYQEASFDRSVLETDAVTRDRIAAATGRRSVEIRESRFELRRMDSLGVTPDIVKIDVQGTELQVVEGMGALLDSHPILMVENGPHLACVDARLRRHGYGIRALDTQTGGLKAVRPDSRELNVFFVNARSPLTEAFG
jgi:FkbM family methyltransferase